MTKRIALVRGSRRVYLVSAGAVRDLRGVQSVTLTWGPIPGFSVTLTSAPYEYLWSIAGATTIQSNIPFSILARNHWGNEMSISRVCYLDTTPTQDVFLDCH
ncbi:hypothetical protein LY474_26510 [Myxococcus stipitatus]|uniref:hypothetical protein n=1 Tax=Myxococcus stipitatus TaxID=83455 RepID=UPI001F485C73|nr:hypothetical protein [Myxococcus stipitatus]MCE9671363.1 hypothetical protein [Myxococcus stipitatus]